MDNHLFELLDEQFPPFNELFCEGIAVSHLKRVEQYIINIIKCAEPGFPKGLQFEYASRCSPKEAFDFAARAGNNNRRTFELAESNVYLVKFYFSFNGEMLKPKHIYLPYVTDGALITIRGARFQIAPVLTDRAISVGADSLFIPLTRAKLTFERVLHHVVLNGATTSTYVAWSTVYNRSAKNIRINGKPQVQAKHTLMHYLLCKYGVQETFARYTGTNVKVGFEDTINPITCPPGEWIICEPTGLKPHGLKDRYYTASPLKVAVPAGQLTPSTIMMLGGFFYVVDHFPDRIRPEFIGDESETHIWRVLLGHLIWGSTVSEGKLAEDVDEHILSLDEYVDDMVRERLSADQIYCTDLYQLFMFVIENMSELILSKSADVGSMYDKSLTVLRYVMSNVVESIFNFTFKLRSNSKKVLTVQDIETAMQRINSDAIMQINKGHGEVITVSYPGDNKFTKITSTIVLQANSAGRSNTANGSLNDQSLLFHSSILEIGSVDNLPKRDPTGRSVGNGHLQCDEAGNTLRNPAIRDEIDRVQRTIAR